MARTYKRKPETPEPKPNALNPETFNPETLNPETPKQPLSTADDINPGVPLKGSIRVPLRSSFKGSIGL